LRGYCSAALSKVVVTRAAPCVSFQPAAFSLSLLLHCQFIANMVDCEAFVTRTG
jgi:hypothetical protein